MHLRQFSAKLIRFFPTHTLNWSILSHFVKATRVLAHHLFILLLRHWIPAQIVITTDPHPMDRLFIINVAFRSHPKLPGRNLAERHRYSSADLYIHFFMSHNIPDRFIHVSRHNTPLPIGK